MAHSSSGSLLLSGARAWQVLWHVGRARPASKVRHLCVQQPSANTARFKAFGAGAGAASMLVLCGLAYYKRQLLPSDSMSGALGSAYQVHEDRSRARIEVEERVAVDLGAEGTVVLPLPEMEALLERRRETLEAARREIKALAASLVREGLAPIFARIAERVPVFSRWYFSYATGLYLVGEGLKAATAHKVLGSGSDGQTKTKHAVAARLDGLLREKYGHLVLRPELNDPELQSVFVACANAARRSFAERCAEADAELRAGIQKAQHQHLDAGAPPPPPRVRLELDWGAQGHKVHHLREQVGRPVESTVALALGGALVGKLGGAAMAKGLTSGVLSKLSAPFVAKAAAGAIGAAAGAAGGPGGAVVGTALGVAVDAAVAKVHGLLHKDEFEREVREAVRASERAYTRALETELCRAVDEWVDEAKCEIGNSSSSSMHRIL